MEAGDGVGAEAGGLVTGADPDPLGGSRTGCRPPLPVGERSGWGACWGVPLGCGAGGLGGRTIGVKEAGGDTGGLGGGWPGAVAIWGKGGVGKGGDSGSQ